MIAIENFNKLSEVNGRHLLLTFRNFANRTEVVPILINIEQRKQYVRSIRNKSVTHAIHAIVPSNINSARLHSKDIYIKVTSLAFLSSLAFKSG